VILRLSYLVSLRVFLIIVVLATAQQPKADVALRNLEITQCTENEITTWGDGKDQKVSTAALKFFYRHDGAPAWLQHSTVFELVKKSVNAWSKCGIPSTLDLHYSGFRMTPETILIAWNASRSFGYFGLADLSQHQLHLGAEAFHELNRRNPTNDHIDTLQMVLSHEMGHFYGLMAHSRRCVDVLSYYHDGRGGECQTRYPHLLKKFPEYRSSLPTTCDIQRCKKLNNKP